MLGSEFQFRDKIPVGILSLSGKWNQKLFEKILHHPWFRLKVLWGPKHQAGESFREAAGWELDSEHKDVLSELIIQNSRPEIPCSLVFSINGACRSLGLEIFFVKAGYSVAADGWNNEISPLIVPDVNPEQLGGLAERPRIAAAAASEAASLSILLKPLLHVFGLEKVRVDHLEDNSLRQTKALTGMNEIDADLLDTTLVERHRESKGSARQVIVRLKEKVNKTELLGVWQGFRGEAKNYHLPSNPEQLIQIHEENCPRLERQRNKRMALHVEDLKFLSEKEYRFSFWYDEIERCAATEVLLLAELMVRKGLIFW